MDAAKAYKLAGDNNSLNKVGDKLMEEDSLEEALAVYKMADNKAMVQFIEENFARDLHGRLIKR